MLTFPYPFSILPNIQKLDICTIGEMQIVRFRSGTWSRHYWMEGLPLCSKNAERSPRARAYPLNLKSNCVRLHKLQFAHHGTQSAPQSSHGSGSGQQTDQASVMANDRGEPPNFRFQDSSPSLPLNNLATIGFREVCSCSAIFTTLQVKVLR